MNTRRIGWLAGVITVCLGLGWPMESGAAKYTAATSSGAWADAIWDNGAPEAGDDVAIDSGVSVTVSVSVVALNSFTNNGTLTFVGWGTVLTSTVVQVNGTITHPPQSATITNESGVWVPDNRVFIVCSNLTVASGGKIDVNYRGYIGNVYAYGYGPGGGVGEASWWGGGGSYGGIGYPGGLGGPVIASPQPYGLLTAPEDPGSAGGGAYGGSPGGNGGGALKIMATGAVTVDGTIAANGQTTGSGGSGGSGGSVFITCQTLQGTGVVSAAAGSGNGYAGSGGGGRIAIIAGSAQDAVSRQTRLVTAAGGVGGSGPGGTGTLYVSRGSILLDANSLLTVGNRFDLRFTPPDFVCDGTLLVTNGGRFSIPSAPTNGTTAYGSLVTIAQDLIVAADSSLIISSHPTNGGSPKIVVRDLIVQSGGLVNASSNGFSSVYGGYGPGCGSLGFNGRGSSGGGYGGVGGMGSGGDPGGGVYGSSNAPADPGSPGGFWTLAPTYQGGFGGGLIWVQASRTIRIDGQMMSDGGNCGTLEGAGSGGGIYLMCKSFAGSGLVRAKGGKAASGGYSGGGGGGRIAVQYENTNDWSGTLSYAAGSVDGGTGGTGNGTAGTIVWREAQAGISGTVMIIR